MHERTNPYDPEEARRRMARANAGSTLFEAVLLLLVGFVFLGGLSGISEWELFNVAVAVTVWAFKIGGLLMLGVAILCWVGCPKALAIDAVVNALIGSALILAGAVWLLAGHLYGLLFLLIGGMLLNSMLRSWRHYRLTGFAAPTTLDEASGDGAERQPAARSVEQVRALLDRRADEAGAARRQVAGGGDAKRTETETAPDARPAVSGTEEPPPEGFLAELGRRDKEDSA